MTHKENGNTTGMLPSLRKLSAENDVWVYTDGSYKTEFGKNEELVIKASWAVVSDDGETFAGPVLNNVVSKNMEDSTGEEITFHFDSINNNLAELMALLMAARYLRNKNYRGTAVVWTDSAWAAQQTNGLSKIHPRTDDEVKDLIQMVRGLFDEIKQGKKVEIKWVKGHDGDEGNEMADKCADLVQKWPGLTKLPNGVVREHEKTDDILLQLIKEWKMVPEKSLDDIDFSHNMHLHPIAKQIRRVTEAKKIATLILLKSLGTMPEKMQEQHWEQVRKMVNITTKQKKGATEAITEGEGTIKALQSVTGCLESGEEEDLADMVMNENYDFVRDMVSTNRQISEWLTKENGKQGRTTQIGAEAEVPDLNGLRRLVDEWFPAAHTWSNEQLAGRVWLVFADLLNECWARKGKDIAELRETYQQTILEIRQKGRDATTQNGQRFSCWVREAMEEEIIKGGLDVEMTRCEKEWLETNNYLAEKLKNANTGYIVQRIRGELLFSTLTRVPREEAIRVWKQGRMCEEMFDALGKMDAEILKFREGVKKGRKMSGAEAQGNDKVTTTAYENERRKGRDDFAGDNIPQEINSKGFNIVLLEVCAGIGGGRRGLEEAMRRAWQRGFQHRLKMVVAWKTNEKAKERYKTMFKDDNTKEMGCVEQMGATTGKMIISPNTRVITTIGTPCQMISKAIFHKKDNDYIGLHAPPSNLIWAAAEGVQRLMVGKNVERAAVVQEMTPAYAVEMEVELNEIFGKPWVARCGGHKWGGSVLAPRTRNFRIDPSIKVSETQHDAEVRDYCTEDGYVWPTERIVPGTSSLPTIRTCIPRLIRQEANKGEGSIGIGSKDREMLKAFQVQYKADPADVRWMKPEHMAALLGYKKEDITKMRQGAECKGKVDKRMGKTKQQWVEEGAERWLDTANFCECGQEVYCENCTDLIEMLGNTWCLKSAAEAVDMALQALENGQRVGLWPKAGKIHQCSSNCPMKKTKKQFDNGMKERMQGGNKGEGNGKCVI